LKFVAPWGGGTVAKTNGLQSMDIEKNFIIMINHPFVCRSNPLL